MYINYINNRQNLEFSCIKDINTIKQLSDFKSTLKNSVTWKKPVILIFSKKVLVAIFTFLEYSYLEPNIDHPSFTSSQVYESCVIKSDTSGFLTSPSHIQDLILKSREGYEELTDEEEEKLLKSILAKAPESDYSEISINKFLKKNIKVN